MTDVTADDKEGPRLATLRSTLLPFLLILFLTACSGPRLASRPMTAEEAAWAGAIDAWYPGWRPPLLPAVRPVPFTAPRDVSPPPPPPPPGIAEPSFADEDYELVPVE